MSYLGNLTFRLAASSLHLDINCRTRHAEYLKSLQTEDGGFPGRSGGGDCYYSAFALRGLTLLGLLDEETARRASAFFVRYLKENRPLPSIDYLSLVFSDLLLDMTWQCSPMSELGLDRIEETERRLAPFKRDDGGYAKTEKSPMSSTYHTFLVSACRQLVGIDLAEEAESTSRLILDRQRDDGGFVELPPLKQSGTNPTAAAIGTLRLLDIADQPLQQRAAAFLLSMQTSEGGLRANGRIPFSDLLSTFTGLVAMHDVDALDRVDLSSLRRYADSLECESGGFRAGHWDEHPDAEYTFYGIGTLAFLHDERMNTDT